MSLTAISSLESARRKCEKKIMKSTYIMSTKARRITCFWAQDAKMSLTAISTLESARIKFLMNSSYIMSTKKESLVSGLRRPK